MSGAAGAEELLRVVSKGRRLIHGDRIRASMGGFFTRPFGRDTYYTLLGLIAAVEDYGKYFVDEATLVGAALSYLSYMSKEGELPHEVGTKEQGFPFEVDKKGFGRHFNSIDATGLALVTIDKLMRLFPKNKRLRKEAPAKLKLMTKWSLAMIGKNKGMVGYSHSGEGSREHTWQDGAYSILTDTGELVEHPVYPVLEQAIYWDGLSRMGERFAKTDLGIRAKSAASRIKKNFNKKFIFRKNGRWGIARAVCADGDVVHSANVDSLMLLDFDFEGRSIFNTKNKTHLRGIVKRLLVDLDAPVGGLRTQGINSPEKRKFQYHSRSSIWPFANCVAIHGLIRVGFTGEAEREAKKVIRMLLKFDLPIETAHLTGKKLKLYSEERPSGETFISSAIQAWTVGWGFWLASYLAENRRIRL